MFDQVLTDIAAAKEWGLITLLVVVLFLYGKSVLSTITRSLHERDRINGEREERMIHVMVGFSESIPKLSAAIDELRTWLGERFRDVDEDLEILKKEHRVIGAKVTDHEGRIGRLERAGEDDEDETVTVGGDS